MSALEAVEKMVALLATNIAGARVSVESPKPSKEETAKWFIDCRVGNQCFVLEYSHTHPDQIGVSDITVGSDYGEISPDQVCKSQAVAVEYIKQLIMMDRLPTLAEAAQRMKLKGDEG